MKDENLDYFMILVAVFSLGVMLMIISCHAQEEIPEDPPGTVCEVDGCYGVSGEEGVYENDDAVLEEIFIIEDENIEKEEK